MSLSAHFTPVVLLILDGWGLGPDYPGNAIKLAKTPNLDRLGTAYPHTQLGASGQDVGLPQGEAGNTETGHLNLGAGQIVYQDLPRINMAVADGSFFNNREFLAAINHVKTHQSQLHLMGLVGSGGVHSSIDHLYALLSVCKSHNVNHQVFLHLFTDGRDSPPTSGITFVREIQNKINELGVGQIASIMGRYYAMDRDSRWDRTEIAYNALTLGRGVLTQNITQSIQNSYEANESDEFIKPIINTTSANQPIASIKNNDAVIFFNFRIDRPRQLTKAFTLPDFEARASQSHGFDPYAVKYHKTHLTKPDLTASRPFKRPVVLENVLFITMTEYEKGLPVHIAFPPTIIDHPLSRVVSQANLRQLKVSETEKERFVTYYFNGQRENPFQGEDWQIIPSKRVPTYDQLPAMSSLEITQALIQAIDHRQYQFIVANFAAPDMVAHTGNLTATIKACEIVDQCIGQIIAHVESVGGVVVITADHGNAEELINLKTNNVDTEHSSFPVPVIIVNSHFHGQTRILPRGVLADVAPTVLELLGISKPNTMTGKSLI